MVQLVAVRVVAEPMHALHARYPLLKEVLYFLYIVLLLISKENGCAGVECVFDVGENMRSEQHVLIFVLEPSRCPANSKGVVFYFSFLINKWCPTQRACGGQKNTPGHIEHKRGKNIPSRSLERASNIHSS